MRGIIHFLCRVPSKVYIVILPQVLRYTAGHINYGGRVTDDIDRRCMMSVLGEFYCPAILSEEHVYSEAGIYRQISPALDHHVSYYYTPTTCPCKP